MSIETPQIVSLKAELSGKELAPLVDIVRSTSGLPAPTTFRTPVGGAEKPIDALDLERLKDAQLQIGFGDGTQATLSAHPRLPGTLLEVWRGDDAGLPADAVTAAQHALVSLLRELLGTGRLQSGRVERAEELVEALPAVPIARRYPAVVTTKAAVEAAYRDPAPFWSAWSEDASSGDLHLLSRHLDVATTADWFRATFDDQWAMARAANPGDTFFGQSVAPPGCEGMLRKGKSALKEVGYRDGYVELAGFVGPNEHVPPWEILHWSGVLLDGALPDGRPVHELRVVFRNEEMARREATPLLDMEAKVAYFAPDGTYQDL